MCAFSRGLTIGAVGVASLEGNCLTNSTLCVSITAKGISDAGITGLSFRETVMPGSRAGATGGLPTVPIRFGPIANGGGTICSSPTGGMKPKISLHLTLFRAILVILGPSDFAASGGIDWRLLLVGFVCLLGGGGSKSSSLELSSGGGSGGALDLVFLVILGSALSVSPSSPVEWGLFEEAGGFRTRLLRLGGKSFGSASLDDSVSGGVFDNFLGRFREPWTSWSEPDKISDASLEGLKSATGTSDSPSEILTDLALSGELGSGVALIVWSSPGDSGC
jgi:hypothetical protein